MVMEYIHGQMGLFIKVFIQMIKEMDMGYLNHLIIKYSKVNGKMVWDKERVF